LKSVRGQPLGGSNPSPSAKNQHEKLFKILILKRYVDIPCRTPSFVSLFVPWPGQSAPRAMASRIALAFGLLAIGNHYDRRLPNALVDALLAEDLNV
jgi:hypothetical protein